MSWQNSGLQQQPRDSATHLESQFRQHFSILQPTTPTPPVQVENIRAIFSFLIATSFQPMYSCRLCLMSMWNFQTFIILNYWSWLLSSELLIAQALFQVKRPLVSSTFVFSADLQLRSSCLCSCLQQDGNRQFALRWAAAWLKAICVIAHFVWLFCLLVCSGERAALHQKLLVW